MSGYGIFESAATDGYEQEQRQIEAQKSLDSAIFAAREQYGEFLGAAVTRWDFDDRLALVRKDLVKTVHASGVAPVAGVMNKVVKALKPNFKAKQAALRTASALGSWQPYSDDTGSGFDAYSTDGYLRAVVVGNNEHGYKSLPDGPGPESEWGVTGGSWTWEVYNVDTDETVASGTASTDTEAKSAAEQAAAGAARTSCHKQAAATQVGDRVYEIRGTFGRDTTPDNAGTVLDILDEGGGYYRYLVQWDNGETEKLWPEHFITETEFNRGASRKKSVRKRAAGDSPWEDVPQAASPVPVADWSQYDDLPPEHWNHLNYGREDCPACKAERTSRRKQAGLNWTNHRDGGLMAQVDERTMAYVVGNNWTVVDISGGYSDVVAEGTAGSEEEAKAAAEASVSGGTTAKRKTAGIVDDFNAWFDGAVTPGFNPEFEGVGEGDPVDDFLRDSGGRYSEEEVRSLYESLYGGGTTAAHAAANRKRTEGRTAQIQNQYENWADDFGLDPFDINTLVRFQHEHFLEPGELESLEQAYELENDKWASRKQAEGEPKDLVPEGDWDGYLDRVSPQSEPAAEKNLVKDKHSRRTAEANRKTADHWKFDQAFQQFLLDVYGTTHGLTDDEIIEAMEQYAGIGTTPEVIGEPVDAVPPTATPGQPIARRKKAQEDEGVFITPESAANDFREWLDGRTPDYDLFDEFLEQYPYADQIDESIDRALVQVIDRYGRRRKQADYNRWEQQGSGSWIKYYEDDADTLGTIEQNPDGFSWLVADEDDNQIGSGVGQTLDEAISQADAAFQGGGF